jgi:hypothetical protein
MASKQSYQLADQKGVSQRVSQQILKSLCGGEIDQWSKPSMLMWLVLHIRGSVGFFVCGRGFLLVNN